MADGHSKLSKRIGNSRLVFTVNHRNIDQLTVKRSKGWRIEESTCVPTSYATIVPEQNIERPNVCPRPIARSVMANITLQFAIRTLAS